MNANVPTYGTSDLEPGQYRVNPRKIIAKGTISNIRTDSGTNGIGLNSRKMINFMESLLLTFSIEILAGTIVSSRKTCLQD